jgi:hypothetical protein
MRWIEGAFGESSWITRKPATFCQKGSRKRATTPTLTISLFGRSKNNISIQLIDIGWLLNGGTVPQLYIEMQFYWLKSPAIIW